MIPTDNRYTYINLVSKPLGLVKCAFNSQNAALRALFSVLLVVYGNARSMGDTKFIELCYRVPHVCLFQFVRMSACVYVRERVQLKQHAT